ncbi:MAG: chorismate mutase [Kaiparowitsia implicata GSE-PSE-MK54-09C]|jgi:chorismate mutase|nr:chorismate mutase [Kaiparowitsia implicata GSE-PSE-MK54-09C]
MQQPQHLDHYIFATEEESYVGWRVQAIRGAVTVPENSKEAIRDAVTELLDELERRNRFNPDDIVSVMFSVTQDLDAIFPAAIARQRPHWGDVPFLDVQHMYVAGSLERCIRILIQINASTPVEFNHAYLREAQVLRPDLCVEEMETVSLQS